MIALISAALAGVCTADPFIQDLNCNGVDVVDEVPVDLTNPECLANANSYGIPYPNADYYYDYVSYGCLVPIIGMGLDLDKDGLGGGGLSLMPDEKFPDITVTLGCDNCPERWNRLQLDSDCDNVGDECDNCPFVYNDTQDDRDNDLLGDACDSCPRLANAAQENMDGDSWGDACDNCPELFQADQADEDRDGVGNDCDNCWEHANGHEQEPGFQVDIDMDGFGDVCDNCPSDFGSQADFDEDGFGDLCDVCPDVFNEDQADRDGDGVGNICDICPSMPDFDQLDTDGDSFGDACDVCPLKSDPRQMDSDFDGIGDLCDSCPVNYDPFQLDVDENGIGDICEDCVGAGWDPGDCAEYAARGGASTCGTPGVPALWAVIAGALLLVRRRVVLIPLVAAGCGFIPGSEREWRLDPDNDGHEWPADCDSTDDKVGVGAPWFLDNDGDGYGGPETQPGCVAPGAGWVRAGDDCDDKNFSVHPGAAEACDGIDQDCNGVIDEGFARFPVYVDFDLDGYGDSKMPAGDACAVIPGISAYGEDCDDLVATTYPRAHEHCNTVDDDCDGAIDEALLAVWWYDGDNDTFGDPNTAIEACEPWPHAEPPEPLFLAEYVARAGDCDDTNQDTYPYAPEDCSDNQDNDCNGIIDDQFERWNDADHDGFGDSSTSRIACEPTEFEVDNNVDCDDTDPYVNPAVPEFCSDGIDNDCDTIIDICEG